ncbi:MAG: YidC/Oxa1 family membrane protein insertase [Planctomycetes bacterium]|nr:YidC/Oxa1 family membrane protein insertase [Planctomycetota bacterium]
MMLAFVLTGTAWAIPSPDVVVNVLASSTQVLGLVSLVFGRWFLNRRRSVGRAANGPAQRIALGVVTGLFVASAVGWWLYHAQVQDERLARLQININRDSREEGKQIVDVSLKELPFSEQLKRTDVLHTDELQRRIERGESLQLLDVRETEEYEVGAIAGARHARFPDVLAAPERYLDKRQPVLLLCANGNRSSELAEHFAGLGYESRFLVGGYEKWVAEDRPLGLNSDGERTELRALPDYPNKHELLDTADVLDLQASRELLIVDVRYPGDFEANHLPGAVNVPMRKLTTPELDAALAALPKRPVVVACYDRRSSFFGLVLGLRLHRMGYEYLGRYTTPESYTAPGKDKPHVAAWKRAHAPKSLLTLAAEPLEGSLTWLSERFGSLALAIVALVLALRLALAPWTAKAERDRRVQAELAPRLSALKVRFGDDRAGCARASARLQREHGQSPMLNFFTTIVQVVVFTLFFTVVNRVAETSTEPFAWVESLGAPDASGVLPVSVALLGAALVAFVSPRRIARWLAPLVGVALGALVWQLNAAANLYLALSLVFVLVQNLCVMVWFARRSSEPRVGSYAGRVVVPLEHAHRVSGCGNKAARLGTMLAAGLPVPRGFVVRMEALEARAEDGSFRPEHRAEIEAAHRALQSPLVAVRSSGINEDGADRSFAGVFESELEVSAERLFDALTSVADSLASARTHAYSGSAREPGAIVVQAMVPARYAGVLFTEHPADSGAAAIELVDGLGDALVSGRAKPRTLKLGRVSGRVLEGGPAPLDCAPLFELGRKVETLFGRPQDIEWAWTEAGFALLQARDVTRLSRHGETELALRQRERARLLELARGASSEEVVFAQNELSELLPAPTPFSLALMESLWAHGGSTDLACRSLGIPYEVEPDSPPIAVSVFGALYSNQREQRRRMRRGPSALTAFRLPRAADDIEGAWRDELLPGLLRDARLRAALDLTRLSLADLTHLFAERRADFVTRVYARAEEINIAADFYLKLALLALRKRGLDPAEHVAHLPPTVVHEANELLGRVGRGEASESEYLALFGHRAPHDYELAEPRYCEAPELVRSLAARAASSRPHGAPRAAVPEDKALELALGRARRFQALKESAKHDALRELAFLRRLALELGARTGLRNGVFQLTPEEVERLGDAAFAATAPELVRARLEERDALTGVRVGLQVRVGDLESLDVEHGGLIPRPHAHAALRGTRVSGTGDLVGRARVLRTADEIAAFEPGEILVARFTDPTWASVFPRAAAIVTEVGGWLSHAAILAREYDLTAVVGVEGALDELTTGELLRVRADGGIERLPERRGAPRVALDLAVRVTSAERELAGRLTSRSASGGLLVLADGTLEVGGRLRVRLEDRELEACVVRNGVPGIYGIAWASP